MTDDSNIGTMLAVAGLFALTFYLLRDPVGDAESAIIAAASCTGLTGATLTACQKANAPKPKPITPAKPRGITAAKPRGITAARPSKVRTQESISGGTGGGVGGPRTKAALCAQRGGTWRCYRVAGQPENQSCMCRMPITVPSRNVLAYNQCIKNARLYTERLKKLATDRNAINHGYSGLNPGLQLLNNNVGTSQAAGYQDRLLREKYDALFKDLDRQCSKKYLGVDFIAQQERGMVPQAEYKNQPV